MKTYITHYTPLKNRKEHIIHELNKHDVEGFEFIEKYDREHLTNDDLKKFRNITFSEISLFLKHVEVFKMNANNNDDIIVIVEDDAVLLNDFKQKLHDCLDKLSNVSWDILFPCACCSLTAENFVDYVKGKLVYESQSSRGTGMYVLNKGVCNKLEYIFTNLEYDIELPIDHWFNYVKRVYDLKYYWSEPPIVEQGSENGIFNKSIVMSIRNNE